MRTHSRSRSATMGGGSTGRGSPAALTGAGYPTAHPASCWTPCAPTVSPRTTGRQRSPGVALGWQHFDLAFRSLTVTWMWSPRPARARAGLCAFPAHGRQRLELLNPTFCICRPDFYTSRSVLPAAVGHDRPPPDRRARLLEL